MNGQGRIGENGVKRRSLTVYAEAGVIGRPGRRSIGNVRKVLLRAATLPVGEFRSGLEVWAGARTRGDVPEINE